MEIPRFDEEKGKAGDGAAEKLSLDSGAYEGRPAARKGAPSERTLPEAPGRPPVPPLPPGFPPRGGFDGRKGPPAPAELLQQLREGVNQLGGNEFVKQGLDWIKQPENQKRLGDLARQLPGFIEAGKAVVEGLQGFEKPEFKDGRVVIRNQAETVIPVGQKQGPVTVEAVKLARELSFEPGGGGDCLARLDVKGIGVKATCAGYGPEFVVRSAGLARQDGKYVLKIGIGHEYVPGLNIPITVPLERPR